MGCGLKDSGDRWSHPQEVEIWVSVVDRPCIQH